MCLLAATRTCSAAAFKAYMRTRARARIRMRMRSNSNAAAVPYARVRVMTAMIDMIMIIDHSKRVRARVN